MKAAEIMEAIKNDRDNNYFGLRVDAVEYEVGDYCYASHALYQDCWSDDLEEGEGIYAGYWDGGELDGTSAVEINAGFDDEDLMAGIESALAAISVYMDLGNRISLIAGCNVEYGEDPTEIVISDAVVLLTEEING